MRFPIFKELPVMVVLYENIGFVFTATFSSLYFQYVYESSELPLAKAAMLQVKTIIIENANNTAVFINALTIY